MLPFRRAFERIIKGIDVPITPVNIDAFNDAFEAAAEGKHLADAGDFAFGEDADYFAVAEGVGCFAQGVDHFARALVGGDGNKFKNFREGLDEGEIVDALEHKEADGAVGGADEQDSVYPGGMIGSEESSTVDRDIFLALQIEAGNRVGC